MPILNPKIQQILRESGLSGESAEESLNEKLNASSLSLQDDLDRLATIAANGETDSVKLRAIETSLKLKGALKEAQAQAPIINIVIQDPNAPLGVNPILIPREYHESNKLN